MYTELSNAAEAKGKVVQGITYALMSGQMVVAFTDETFIAFGTERGYDDDAVYSEPLDLEEFGRDALVASGIITEEERARKVAEYYAELSRGREAAERRRYEQLKAKFE